MSDEIKTMKVKPWGKNQGDYVVINFDDYDPERHTPYEPTESRVAKEPAKQATSPALRKKRKKKTR